MGNDGYLPMVARQLLDQHLQPRLLAVGAGENDSRGVLLKLGPELLRRTVQIDLIPYRGIDVVADGDHLPFADASFHCILLIAVLEHVRDLDACVKEVRRVLKPGGWIVVDVPFLQPFHGAPSDYRRLTRQGIQQLFPEAETVASGLSVGPTRAMALVAQTWLAMLVSFGNRRLFYAARLALRFPMALARPLDRVLVRNPDAELIAGAFFWVGRTPPTPEG